MAAAAVLPANWQVVPLNAAWQAQVRQPVAAPQEHLPGQQVGGLRRGQRRRRCRPLLQEGIGQALLRVLLLRRRLTRSDRLQSSQQVSGGARLAAGQAVAWHSGRLRQGKQGGCD